MLIYQYTAHSLGLQVLMGQFNLIILNSRYNKNNTLDFIIYYTRSLQFKILKLLLMIDTNITFDVILLVLAA